MLMIPFFQPLSGAYSAVKWNNGSCLDTQYSQRQRVPTKAYQGAVLGERGVRDKSTGVSRYSRDKNVSTPRGGGST